MFDERKYICPKDCPDRKVTADYNCHSHCERHLKFQIQQRLKRKIKGKLAEHKQAEWDAKHKVRRIGIKLEQRDRERGIRGNRR